MWHVNLTHPSAQYGSHMCCLQQRGDIHGRGQVELQGYRPRATTRAIVDRHLPCPRPATCRWPLARRNGRHLQETADQGLRVDISRPGTPSISMTSSCVTSSRAVGLAPHALRKNSAPDACTTSATGRSSTCLKSAAHRAFAHSAIRSHRSSITVTKAESHGSVSFKQRCSHNPLSQNGHGRTK